MRPDQLPLLQTVSGLEVHPSGRWAVVAVSRPDFDADGYVGQLWRVNLDGSGARRITRGAADSSPRFTPDGSLIGFLRAPEDGRPQVFVVSSEGGEPVQVTDEKLGVGEFAFSPAGTLVAFISRVAAEGRYGTLEGVAAGQEDPRHITGLQYHANGLGWTVDRPRQVFVADVPSPLDEPRVKAVGRAAKDRKPDELKLVAPARRLTTDDIDYQAPVFTPDGAAVVVTAARHESRESDLRADLWSIPVGGGEPTRVLDPGTVSVGGACYVGDVLFFGGAEVGASGRDFIGQAQGVFTLRDDVAVRLTDAETVDIAGDLAPDPGHDAVLTIEGRRGTARVVRVRADGVLEVVLDGSIHAAAAAAIPGSDDVIVVRGNETEPSEVVRVAGGVETRLTDFGGPLREAMTVVVGQELTATSPDGHPVHGWVYLPAGEGPHKVLLNIHGGPEAAYGPAFFDEFQIYVEAGYAVVACNPRGSGGYGPAHARAIKGDFGNLDMADVLAFLEHALAVTPGLDPDAIGIMGGSYGGYLTAWIEAHDHRWRGAIVERGFLDAASFAGASDIGWFFQREYNGDDRAGQDRQSPMTFTSQVTTPTLVLHSENDLRCPLAQALRYYTELKLNGVDAELLVFPGETHELSRSGTPWHRRQRFEAILDFWARKFS